MPRSKPDLLPGTLELLLLQTLAAGPKHGYAVARRIQDTSEDVLSIEEGSLYPALHRMEKRGWIRAEWGLSEANRKAKYYRLTGPGRRQLVKQHESWTRISRAIDSVLEAGGAEA